MGFGLDGRGSNSGKGKKCFSSPQLPGWFQGPLSILSHAYRGILSRAYSDRGAKLTADLNL